MNITFRSTKAIPGTKIHELFHKAGWIKPRSENPISHAKIDGISNHTIYLDANEGAEFLQRTFENSTAIFIAEYENEVIGFVRVLSDRLQRSLIYDLVVDPNFQNRGVGKRLLQMCISAFSETQITIGTSSGNFPFYAKFGFLLSGNYMELATDAY